MSFRTRIIKPSIVLVAGLIGLIVPVGSTTAGADGRCDNMWGSLPKQASAEDQGQVVDVRTGRHECFDRIVVDIEDGSTGFQISYVDQLVEDGRGNTVPLRGGAALELRVLAPAHDEDFNPTYSPADRTEAVSVAGYSTFRQVHFVGSFEGHTQIGLGVRARLPFTAFVLPGPGDGARLVVDVAHRWPAAPSARTTTFQVFFSTGDGSDCGEVTGFDRTIPFTRTPLQSSLEHLVEGPNEAERAQGAGSLFTANSGSSIKSVNLKPDGLLIVDFADFRDQIPNASTSCGSAALLSQLNSTVFQFASVDRVRYRIEESCQTFGDWLQAGECIEFDRAG